MFGFEQFSVEMVLVLALGLMVLGPKELPVVLRRLGQFVGKMRGMAAEFRASFDELARQSEIDDLRKEVEALKRGEFASSAPAPEPAAVDYNPFDNAAHGLDNTGFSFPPQPRLDAQPIMAEGAPPAEAEIPTKPARKPRTKKAAETATEPVAEPSAEAVAKKPRRTRAKPAVAAAEGEGV
jgi:sec-independent protein translocase protein TatB